MINNWKELNIWNSEEFIKLINIIDKEYQTKTIYPSKDNIFNALKLTPYNKVKVVIVGQDPYHGEGEAHGLSFSVQKGIKIPPSLRNIYKELESDIGIKTPNNGDLTKWAEEGVLLLNSSLTVIKDQANSHKDIGWSKITDYLIQQLNLKKEPIVFILWGNFARSKKTLITNKIHKVIESVHPSPLSAYNGFFGSKPFSQTNEYLIANKKAPINWQL